MRDFKYDLHIHSCLSPCAENDMTPANIAGLASLLIGTIFGTVYKYIPKQLKQ